MKKYYSKIIVFLVIVMVCTLTIGYSAFGTELSISKVVANVRVQKDVRITNVELGDYNSTGTNDFNFDSDSVLGNAFIADGTEYFNLYVTITNFGNVDVYIYDMASSGELFAETIDGGSGNVVPALGGTHEVLLYVFPESFDGARNYSLDVSFNFQRMFNVTFEGIDIDDGMAVENDPYNIYLGEELANDIEIYMDNVLLDESKYLIDYGQLIIKKVTGDVVIKKREKVAKLVSGTLTTPGSEICIKDECFYTLINDGNTIPMLAKYNLHVGYEVPSSQTGTLLSNPTKLQSSDAIGYRLNKSGTSVSYPFIGTTGFAASKYWESSVSSYPAYVYNYNSIPYNHIIDYRVYLNNNGLRTKDVRLISHDELEGIGCSMAYKTCENAPSWIYSTSYWTGSANDANYVWRVDVGGYYACNSYNNYFDVGVRPVVEISVNEISDYITFTICGATYHADKDMTWVQWVDSEYNTGTVYLDYENVNVGAGSSLLLNGVLVNSGDRIVANGVYVISAGWHDGGSND